jgi:Kef-type K+ transport system membrane component KefB
LTDDKTRLPAKHTARISTPVDHFAACSLYVLLVIIEVFFLTVRDQSFARIVLYKVSTAIVSRSFYENNHRRFDTLRIVLRCLTFNERESWPAISRRL